MNWNPSIVLLAVLLWSLPALAQGVTPRYKLEVGQEMQYRHTPDSRFDAGGGYRVETSWTVWVVGHNGDGSWQVIERRYTHVIKLDAPGQALGQPEAEVGRCNLFPDGKMEKAEGVMAGFETEVIFPRLPESAGDKNWKSISPPFDYSALPSNAADHFFFHFNDGWPRNQYYLIKHSGTLRFDMQRGLVSSGTDDWDQGYPRHSTSAGTLSLVSTQMNDTAFTAQLSRESDVYFKAAAEYDRAISDAVKDADKAVAIMQAAKSELQNARTQISLPLLAKPLDTLLAAHDQRVKANEQATRNEAQHIATVMNKPAAAWELKDLSGNTHRLADYRGKVVVMDFWHRACPYCWEAMPQIKQVVDDFKNDPVVVLGMNTDEDAKDAQFIVDRMTLNYMTLRAAGVPEKYDVQGFPTVVVIDQQGVIRAVHVGYSDDLRQELQQDVRKLLPAK